MGQRTPLYDLHLALGAKMVDFGGWDMPLHYGSQVEEHHEVRRDCGVFDVSPIAGFIIAVSGLVGLKPYDLIKRNAVQLACGYALSLAITYFIA